MTLAMSLMIAESHGQDFLYTTNNGAITITGSTATNGLVGQVTIPSTIDGLPVVSIGVAAFENNFYLTSVTVPGSVNIIEDFAFGWCTNLYEVSIRDGVTSIGNSAFYDCFQLTLLTIPNTVSNIAGFAFAGCTSLRQVVLPSGISDIQEGLLEYCSSLNSVTIPNGVTNIGFVAFFSCWQLPSVTIPKSVTNLQNQAFYSCDNLRSVYFRGNPPSFGSGVFLGFNNAPSGATAYYLPGMTGWGATFDGLPTVLWNPRMLRFGVGLNGFGFNIAGTPNIPILLEASTNGVADSWVPLLSRTLTSGLIYFSDAQWTNFPRRFYRIRSP